MNSTPNAFEALGISGQLLKATAAVGYTETKPIQDKAIPTLLQGRDLVGVAQTGSGKTAAFALPILAKIVGLGTKRAPKSARALVLVPTRELAVQIDETFRKLSKGAHVSTALVLGGVSRFSQVKKLQPGVDVLIATPGRLTDLVRERDVTLADTKWLVLDEADRMLDMGFINDVRRLAKATAPDRQTMLFSATMPPEIEALAQGLLKDPVRVEVAPQGTTAAEIRQSVVMARTKQKRQVLATMLADEAMRSVIVFSRTKHGADRITRDLERDGLPAAVIHGNKSQNARQNALNGFREGKVRILVATDIAARGIDVPGISHVVNFDLPDEAESYVHRIGRTGRNGADGVAITLCDPSENAKLRSVEKTIRMKLPVTADHTGQPDPQREPRDPNTVRHADRAGQERPDGNRQGKPNGKTRNGHRKPEGAKPFGHKQHGKPGRHQPHGGQPQAQGKRREDLAAGEFHGLPASGAHRPEGAMRPDHRRPFNKKRRFGGRRPARAA
ncbi:MAG: DEAD/DEAH box helicase [Rhizobiaceae bacterium]|nr:DEAD/DEAH box helicase [Rhizobiaceae bacterium]